MGAFTSDNAPFNKFDNHDDVAQIFDHDEPSREKEAYITVRASDNGQPQLDDACTIKILIEDINDNQPVFDKVVSIAAKELFINVEYDIIS